MLRSLVMFQQTKIRTISYAVKSVFLNPLRIATDTRLLCLTNYVQNRGKRGNSKDSLSSLFIPLQVRPTPDDINVGAELTGNLNKADLLKVLNKFYQNPAIKQLLNDNGLDCEYSYFITRYLLIYLFNRRVRTKIKMLIFSRIVKIYDAI